MPPKKQKVLQQDDEPKVTKEPGVEEDEVEPRCDGEGVGGGDGVVEGGAAAAVGAGRVIGKSGSGSGEFIEPHFVAFDDEGNLVVSDNFNDRIQVLRFWDGKHLRTIGSQGVGKIGKVPFMLPEGIAFDGSGHIVVADYFNHCLRVLRYRDGAHVRSIGKLQLCQPSGVAIDYQNHVWVLGSMGVHCGHPKYPFGVPRDSPYYVAHDDDANGRIQVFRLSDGVLINSICSPGSGNGKFSGEGCVAFDDEGNLVVSDSLNHRIQVLRYPEGVQLRTIGSEGAGNGQFSGPHGIAFDRSGDLVVADCFNNRVQVLRYRDGAHVRSIGITNPNGVAIDGDGRIVVCDTFNHRLQVLP